MIGERSRLAAWCLGLSIMTAVAVWALTGTPEPQATVRWHSHSPDPVRPDDSRPARSVFEAILEIEYPDALSIFDPCPGVQHSRCRCGRVARP